MAGKRISQATNVEPTGTDKLPIARASSGTAYNVLVSDLRSHVIDVHDYGAVGDGVTDDSTAINLAITTASVLLTGVGQTRAGRVKLIFRPDLKYLIASPVCIWDAQGIVLDGGAPNFGAVLIGTCADKAMIEIIGSSQIVMQNFQLWGDQTDTPACGTWTSRSNTLHGTNSNNITFRNIEYLGYYTKCCHYCVESESNHFYECWTYPSGNTGMDSLVHISATNDLSVTPAGGTLAGTGYGNNDMQIVNCGLTSSPGYTSVKITNGCDAYLQNTYVYSVTESTIELVQTATFRADNLMCEGTPDNTIKLTRTSGTPSWTLLLTNCNLGTPNNYSILSDANGILANARFLGKVTPGISGGAYMPVKIYRAEACDFSGLCNNASEVFDINIDAGYSYMCKFILGANDTLTYTNEAYTYGDIIENYSTAGRGISNPSALIVGNNAESVTILNVLTATTSWNPGSLADGASETKYIAVTGLNTDGTWVCFASLTSIATNNWQISAYPGGGVVFVAITNQTGDTVDLADGTLRVIAMKVA